MLIGRIAQDIEEVDELLVEWHESNNVTKGNFQSAVAAVELLLPDAKRNLPWCYAVISGNARNVPVVHKLPMPRSLKSCIVIQLGNLGEHRMGAGLWIQWAKGLRPSEVLKIQPEDVLLPEQMSYSLGNVAVITLGARTGTKLKRAQSVIIRADSDPITLHLLRWLVKTTPKGQTLVGLSYGQYGYRLKKVCAMMGLPK